ncbi:hypothetical protein D3C81_171030 [compost metagenome]
MATFYESFEQGMRNGIARREATENRNRLAELQSLAPQVIAGDLTATDRAYALDPRSAQAYQAEGSRQQEKLVGLAKSLKKYDGNPQLQAAVYNSAIPYLSRSFGEGNIPKVWDSTVVMPIVDQVLAAAAGQPTAQGDQFTLSPGSKRFDATGNVVAEVPFAPASANVIDVPDGRNGSMKMVWDPVMRQLAPLPGAMAGTAGTPTSMATSGAAAATTVFRAPNGEIIDMSKVTEPGLRESILQNPEEWGLVPDGGRAQLPDRNIAPPGGLGYTPPKQREAPSGYTYQGDSLTPIPGGPADNSSPQAVASGEQSLRKEVTQNLKDDQGVLSMYRNVQAAARQPSAAGDLSMIFAFMKMLDPGSVVREQEFANAQNAAGVPDQVRNAYNKAISGQRLNPAQRQDFMNQAAQLATNAEGRITGTTRKYQEIARQYGYDPVRGTGMADFSGVTSSVSGGPQAAMGPARPQTEADFNALPSGSLYIDPDDGRTYRKR